MPRYLDRTLELSGASLLIPVGKKARLEVARRYGGPADLTVTGPIAVAHERVMMIAPLGAPAGPEKKTFSTAYDDEAVERVRRYVGEIRSAKASHHVNDVMDEDGSPFPLGPILE